MTDKPQPETDEMVERLRYLAADFRKNGIMLSDNYADALQAVLDERDKLQADVERLQAALAGLNPAIALELIEAAIGLRDYTDNTTCNRNVRRFNAALAATEPKGEQDALPHA